MKRHGRVLAAACAAFALGASLGGCRRPLSQPTGLAAAVDGTLVRLSWTFAGGEGPVVVLRRLNAAVAGPDDAQATQVFFGEGRSATDEVSALQPDVPESRATYSYAVYGCRSRSDCERIGSAATLTPTLVQALRAGGYVIYWRHADATVCADGTHLGTAAETKVPNWWKSCDRNCPVTRIGTATARQLSVQGPIEAAAIGQAFDVLGIPIGQVRACEYCRCVATAEQMDFGPPIEQVPEITFFVYDEANRCARTQELLAVAPPPRTNTAIVATRSFPGPCPVIEGLNSAEAAIYKPDGRGGTTLVTRMKWDAWKAFLGPQPTQLAAKVSIGKIHLTWTAPDPSSGLTGVRLLRRLNRPVAGPTDPEATPVYNGTDSDFVDDSTVLLPDTPQVPRAYYYAVYGCAATTCEPLGSATPVWLTVGDTLRGGGYTIYWRHAEADVCEDRPGKPDWWKSCDADCATATAGQLSDGGRKQATGIGKALRDRKIPIGRMLSSEFCRAVTTAELMELGKPIEQLSDLTMSAYASDAERCQKSFEYINTPPAPGTNTAIISHPWQGFPCGPITNLDPAAAGIFKPDGRGGTTFIALVAWHEWYAVY